MTPRKQTLIQTLMGHTCHDSCSFAVLISHSKKRTADMKVKWKTYYTEINVILTCPYKTIVTIISAQRT